MKTLYYTLLLALFLACLSSCNHPKYVSDYDLRKAEEAYGNDDYDEALSLVEKQLKATPKHIDALYLKALILANDGQSYKAVSVLDQAWKCYGGKPETARSTILALGLILQEEERYPEAAKVFGRAAKKARKDEPDNVQRILFEQAQCYYLTDNRAAAEKVYQRMLKDNPEDAAAMVGLAAGSPQSDSLQLDSLQAGALLSEIPMRRKPGGTYEVPCAINGLPLKFIFDTGASDVTLSSVEADFMLKNDYLSEKDFRGSRKYRTASGSICDGALVCLKEVRVGDVTLKNVEASVVRNQQAPLLLGQSALERLGRITIDNESSRLIIKRKPGGQGLR